MSATRFRRRAFTIVELLVVMMVISVMIALLLSAVQTAREAARRAWCTNNLKQIGIALHEYHDTQSAFPPGYVARMGEAPDGKGWAWGTLLLPYVEQGNLHDELDPLAVTVEGAASNASSLALLQTPLPVYRCPSDTSERLSHQYRAIVLPSLPSPSMHAFPPPPPPPPPPTPPPPPPPPVTVSLGAANYVASFGTYWDAARTNWSNADFTGNGLFGRNSRITMADVKDGTSHTFAVGERSWRNYAAVWPGLNSWQGCGFFDNQMVLATTYHVLNDDPISVNIDCDGSGSAGFSSRHAGGANFLFADGSVHFVSETIEFRTHSSPAQMGVYQKLSQRNDGGTIHEY